MLKHVSHERRTKVPESTYHTPNAIATVIVWPPTGFSHRFAEAHVSSARPMILEAKLPNVRVGIVAASRAMRADGIRGPRATPLPLIPSILVIPDYILPSTRLPVVEPMAWEKQGIDVVEARCGSGVVGKRR